MSRLAPHNLVSDVPHALLAGKTEDERWLYDQQSIQRQLLERVCLSVERGDEDRQALRDSLNNLAQQSQRERKELHDRIVPFEALKEQWTGKKALISLVLSAIIVPVALLFAGAFISSWVATRFGK